MRQFNARSRWLAACAAMAFALAAATTATAQASRPAAVAFALPSQPLDEALIAFSRMADIQVLYGPELVRGRRSAPLEGRLAPEEALNRLLQGTGLQATPTGPRTFVLARMGATLAAEDAVSVVDEIIVTAQKRDQQAQDVPIALTGFSAGAVDRFRLESLRDVSRLTPGLLVSAFNQSSPTIAIRGATNTFTQIGANKPVAVVIDDLFIPRNSAATFELYGLNSIQVLRGPQGTLFGRNVTGGAIVLDTGRPTLGAPGGSARVGAGSFNLRQFDGFVDAPLGEDAAVRLAASVKTRDGYGRDRLTGREQDDLESTSVRAQARFQPSDTLEVLLGADYSDDHNGGRTLSSLAGGDDGDRRTSELGFDQAFDRNQWGASARLYWDLPSGRLSSITGYRQSQSGEDYSGTGTSYRFLTSGVQTVNRDLDQVNVFSQEVRYASPRWARGDFVVGAYLAVEEAARQLTVRNLAAVTGAVTSNVLTDQAVDTLSYAVFADGVFRLTPELALTLGARFTHDEKTAALNRVDVFSAAGNFSARDLKAEWDKVTPRAVLTWTPRPDLSLYASATQGYTAGGFNTDAAALSALTTPFEPEEVANYELGLKSEWLNRRLRVNAALFHMDYTDKHELFFNNVTRILTITNAGQATVKGAELEVAYRPAPWLGLSATYGYLDTVYDEFIIPGGAVYTGNRLGSSPRDKASLAADLNLPLGDAGYLLGTASWSYMDHYNTGAAADPRLEIPSYALANLSLGYEPTSRNWRLMGWVKNLTDKDYVLTNSTQTILAEYLGEPRTWGLTLSASF